MNSIPQFAIIGCGKIASRHAAEAAKHGQIMAVCDILPERADALALQCGAAAYYDFDNLLEKETGIDIISVCTPNGLHAMHSIKAMQAGMHVLCEKPMAISSNDAKKMIGVSEVTGRQLFVVKQNRFNPPVVLVKQLVEDGALGTIFNFQLNCFWNRPHAYYTNAWRGSLDLDGGTLFTQFSHFIDLLYWYLGDVISAEGHRANYLHKGLINYEDTGVATLKMKAGSIGTINYTINSYEKNMEGSFTLFGDKGSVKIGGQYLNELEYFSMEGKEKPELISSHPANEYGFYKGSMSNHDKVYEMLIRAIDDPGFSFITMEETLKTIEIIEKIYAGSPLID